MLEPFQCIFILACALWAVGQVLPSGTIQNKLQATGGMVMMLIGVIVTGIITVPQFDDKDTPVTTYQATKASVEVEDREALSQRMREQQARYVMDELARPMPEVGRR